jgi:hypothetical protein
MDKLITFVCRKITPNFIKISRLQVKAPPPPNLHFTAAIPDNWYFTFKITVN